MKTWYVIADPAWKGKHPLHDARFVATCDESKIEVIDHGEEKRWRFEDPADSIICTMPDSPEQKAHAHLIAAAPDLLEACKGLVEGFDAVKDATLFEMMGPHGADQEGNRIQARAAIAKAGGAL